LNDVIHADRALLLTGSYSARDRDEQQAPFIVEQARPLDELRVSGAVAVALSWSRTSPPDPTTARAAAALCAAHPGAAPVVVEWGDGNGTTERLRSRSLRVDPADDLLVALRELLGADHVHLRAA
jgi:hypothetical protein